MIAELSFKKKEKETVGLLLSIQNKYIPRILGGTSLTNTLLWQTPFPISVFARSVILFKNPQLLCDSS